MGEAGEEGAGGVVPAVGRGCSAVRGMLPVWDA